MQNHFRFIANNLALDYANTIVMRNGERFDLLEKSDDLQEWLKQAGMLISGTIDETIFKTAISLRSAIRNSIHSVTDKIPFASEDIKIINTALKNKDHQTVLAIKDKTLYLEQETKAKTPLSALAEIALQAAEILTDGTHERIKSCSNEECILMFHDTSKSGRRRWCSMEICGNRAKASKHYHTHKS